MNTVLVKRSQGYGDRQADDSGLNPATETPFYVTTMARAYLGQPVYGFHTTQYGAPTDRFGRLIYLDTFDSTYGSGWKRENSFVPHNPTGAFCYGFYSFDPTKGGYQHPPGWTGKRGPGTGEKYRITAGGPGVTPNVATIVTGLHPFERSNPDDVAWQAEQSAVLLSYDDRLCRAGI